MPGVRLNVARERVATYRRWLTPPRYPRTRLTAKRLLNFYLSRYEEFTGRLALRGYPLGLHFEGNNTCNLRCPACFTGAGIKGRAKGYARLELFEKLLDELGDRLLFVEPFKWGDPLLHPHIADMVAMAYRRGVGTTISTNFSMPVDDDRIDALVRSGLAVLGVPLDGATQASYEQYRRGGDIEVVFNNVRRVNAAKERLCSPYPRIAWAYHVFPHNRHEVELARAKAAELDMELYVSKGWVEGDDFEAEAHSPPIKCYYLWQRATVTVDGSVSPCCGAYQPQDDFGSLGAYPTSRAEPVVPLASMATSTFREAWNNERFQAARALFTSRTGAPPLATSLICYHCPVALNYAGLQDHLSAGGTRLDYQPAFFPNDGFNYVWRRGASSAVRNASRDP